MRCQDKIDCASRLVTGTVNVARAYPEPKLAGREIGVKRLPARAGVDPVLVVSLQHVPESNPAGADKTQSGVVEFQILEPRREIPDRAGAFALPITMTSSMTTGGGGRLRCRRFGSRTISPRMVEN